MRSRTTEPSDPRNRRITTRVAQYKAAALKSLETSTNSSYNGGPLLLTIKLQSCYRRLFVQRRILYDAYKNHITGHKPTSNVNTKAIIKLHSIYRLAGLHHYLRAQPTFATLYIFIYIYTEPAVKQGRPRGSMPSLLSGFLRIYNSTTIRTRKLRGKGLVTAPGVLTLVANHTKLCRHQYQF